MTEQEVNDHMDRIMEVIECWVQHIPSENDYDHFLKDGGDWKSAYELIINTVPVHELLWGQPIYIDMFKDRLCKFLAKKEKEYKEKRILDALDSLPG